MVPVVSCHVTVMSCHVSSNAQMLSQSPSCRDKPRPGSVIVSLTGPGAKAEGLKTWRETATPSVLWRVDRPMAEGGRCESQRFSRWRVLVSVGGVGAE